ncbi:MAG: NYN domain-containing protein [SAR202 cluster bacterium]|nr:NYN domain-containing protein [SAR202 cluster bacterium]
MVVATQNSERQLAVLIDFENVGFGAIQWLFDQVSDMGRVIVRRAYADWSTARSKRDQLLELGIEPIHLFHTTGSGKNSSDIRLAIDAVDLLYLSPVDTFVIVSSDSDFVPLVGKLRSAGKTVVGAGRQATASRSLVISCDRYFYLDQSEKAQEVSKTSPERPMSTDSLLVRAVKSSMDEQGRVSGSKLHQTLMRLDPSFDFRVQGYSTFTRYLENAPGIKVTRPQGRGDLTVELGSADAGQPHKQYQAPAPQQQHHAPPQPQQHAQPQPPQAEPPLDDDAQPPALQQGAPRIEGSRPGYRDRHGSRRERGFRRGDQQLAFRPDEVRRSGQPFFQQGEGGRRQQEPAATPTQPAPPQATQPQAQPARVSNQRPQAPRIKAIPPEETAKNISRHERRQQEQQPPQDGRHDLPQPSVQEPLRVEPEPTLPPAELIFTPEPPTAAAEETRAVHSPAPAASQSGPVEESQGRLLVTPASTGDPVAQIDAAWSQRAPAPGKGIMGAAAANLAAAVLGVPKLSESQFKTLQGLLDSSEVLRSKWQRQGNRVFRKELPAS